MSIAIPALPNPSLSSYTMAPDKSFVISNVFGGGTFDLDAIQGGNGPSEPASDQKTAGQELVWPLVPLDYEPPSSSQQNAVREVAYISVVLKTHAPPRPDDDVELLSLLLLSLETRQDLSQRVLQYTEAEHALNAIVRKCDSAEANAFDLAGRAKELQRHWRSFHSENRDANKDATGDVPYTAMKAAADAGKPADWKLELSEAAASDADNLFKAIRMEREHACSFFRRNTPTPMAWHPKDGEAWKTVDKRMLQTGQLHHSPHFTPIYMGFPLQAIDVSFTWKNPDWDDEQVAEYSKAKDFKRQFESTKGSYPLRSEDVLKSQ